MDTGLLIDMFVPNVGVVPPPSKPTAPNAERFASVPADSTPAVNDPQGITPDNTPSDTQEQLASEPHQDFDCTLREQIGLNEPQKGQNTSESEMKTSTPSTQGASPAASQPAQNQPEGNNSQIVSTQASLTATAVAMPGKAAAATPGSSSDQEPGPKIPGESVQLANGSKITQLPNLTTGASKQTATEPPSKIPGESVQLANGSKIAQLPNLTTATSKQAAAEPGSAAPAVPESADKPAQSTVDQSQTGTETVQSDIFKGLSITDTGSKQGGKTAGFLVSDKALIVEQGPAEEGNGKGLVTELIAEGGKIATGDEKSADVVKSAVSSATPAPHNNMAVTGGVSTDSQLGGDGLSPKKSVSAFGEADNKADIGQQYQGLPESPDGSGKEAGFGEKGLPGESILQKLNVTEVQVSSGQVKGRNGTASNNNSSNSDFERVLSHDNAQIPVAEQPSAAAQAGKAAGNASSSDVSAAVSEQIQESIYSSVRQGDQQITIRLHPPELGKVFIKFQEQDDQITGLLEVSKAQTRAEIQQALPEIVRNLQGLGVQIRRLEVVLTNEQERQAFTGQSLTEGQDSWAGRQSSTNPDQNGTNAAINEWLVNNSIYKGYIGPSEAFITDKSIDMLA